MPFIKPYVHRFEIGLEINKWVQKQMPFPDPPQNKFHQDTEAGRLLPSKTRHITTVLTWLLVLSIYRQFSSKGSIPSLFM